MRYHKLFKDYSTSWDRPFVWKGYWIRLSWPPGGVSGNHQSGVDRDSDLGPTCTCRLCGVRAQHRNKMAERAAFPALPWSQTTLFPVRPRRLLSCLLFRAGGQSEWVHQRANPCGPLRKTPGAAAAPLRHGPHWFPRPAGVRASLPGAGALGRGGRAGAGAPCSGGPPRLRYPSPYLPHLGCGASLFVRVSTPPTWLLLNIFSYRVLVQLDFRQLSIMVFL